MFDKQHDDQIRKNLLAKYRGLSHDLRTCMDAQAMPHILSEINAVLTALGYLGTTAREIEEARK